MVIIGGATGMGKAIATLCAEHGAKVTIGSRSVQKLEATAAEIGCAYRAIDTTQEDSVQQFFTAMGQVDHLVISGSSVRGGTLRDMSLEDGLFSMSSKFWGPYLCAKHARINPKGSLTLFSGILSRRPGKNDAVLGPINAAVEALGRALARDLAPVRVNTLSPGMTRDTAAYLGMPEQQRENMYAGFVEKLPVGRVGTPQDIAEATVMLMTNAFITGVTLDVDGGGLLV